LSAQQYSAAPAFPRIGELHVSVGYEAFGGSDESPQEKPKDPGAHPVTVASGPQRGEEAGTACRQQ
jgi:hypothetical protein